MLLTLEGSWHLHVSRLWPEELPIPSSWVWVWSPGWFGVARRSRGALLTSIHAPQLEGFQPQAPAAHLRTFWSPEPMQPRYTRRPQVSQSPVSGQQDTLLSDALYALPPSLVGLGVAHSVTYNLLYYLLPLCCLASQVNDYFLGCPHTTPPPARNYRHLHLQPRSASGCPCHQQRKGGRQE